MMTPATSPRHLPPSTAAREGLDPFNELKKMLNGLMETHNPRIVHCDALYETLVDSMINKVTSILLGRRATNVSRSRTKSRRRSSSGDANSGNMKKPRQNQPPSAKKQVQVDSSNKQKLFGWAALLLGKGDHHQHPSLTQLSKEVAGVLLKEDEERGSLILNHHGQLRPISRGSLFLALAGPQVDAGYSPLKL